MIIEILTMHGLKKLAVNEQGLLCPIVRLLK